MVTLDMQNIHNYVLRIGVWKHRCMSYKFMIMYMYIFINAMAIAIHESYKQGCCMIHA